jgi:hypothetical protein
VRDFETRFYSYLDTEQPDILTGLSGSGGLDDTVVASMRSATEAFKDTFTA